VGAGRNPAALGLLFTWTRGTPAMAAIHISTMSTPLTGYFGESSVDPGNLNQLARSLVRAYISCSGGHEFESLVGRTCMVLNLKGEDSWGEVFSTAVILTTLGVHVFPV
jgi:hypothetical protein